MPIYPVMFGRYPNITGAHSVQGNGYSAHGPTYTSGAFKRNETGYVDGGKSGSGAYLSEVGFDASASSSYYSSDSVQPSALQALIIIRI